MKTEIIITEEGTHIELYPETELERIYLGEIEEYDTKTVTLYLKSKNQYSSSWDDKKEIDRLQITLQKSKPKK